MNKTRKHRKKKSRKKLAYGAIVVAFIFVCFLIYFSLHSSPPKVAIVDHLSFFPEQCNQTFVNACINILEEGGLTWTYYEGEEVTVNFYRNLPSCGTSLIILRVHSAIMRTENETISILGLFTSERYSEEAAKNYPDDVNNRRLVEAFFSEEERQQGISYFGIVPKFIEESMKGKFKDTIIIMMGCEGLGYEGQTYTEMAEAFIKKGAKVYISWNGPVSVNHTDQATVHLLQRLILKKRTIKEAVEQTNYDVGPDPIYNSTLKYYPKTFEVKSHIILDIKYILTMNFAYTSPILRVLARSKHKSYR
jgi:hypothetical protein